MSQSQQGSDTFTWWFLLWNSFNALLVPPRRFVTLLLFDPAKVGSGYTFFMSCVFILLIYKFYLPIGLMVTGSINADFVHGMMLYALWRAWKCHGQRDKSRGRADRGQLRVEYRYLLQQLLPARCLTETLQQRMWTPLILWLASYLVELICPASAWLMGFTAVWAFLIPGILASMREARLRSRIEKLQQTGERATEGAVPFSPVTPDEFTRAVLPFPWEDDDPTEVQYRDDQVICPYCEELLELDGNENDIMRCVCGQEFRVPSPMQAAGSS